MPVAIVIAAIIFKGELKGLLQRLRSGKVLGTEWEFGEGIQKLEEGRAVVEDQAKTPDQISSASEKTQRVYSDDRMAVLAQEASRNPSYAILTAWEMVRGTTRDLLGTIRQYPANDSALPSGSDELRMLRDAEKQKVISEGLANLYQELRDLRNHVAHGSANPTPGEAVAYVESADFLAALLAEEIDSLIARFP